MTDTASERRPAARSEGRPRPAKSSATIYDIARLAGVNPSTVSRALSKPGRISAKTEKKIRDAAAELNYRVNLHARALPTGRTNTVGVVVADITNPVLFDIVRGAEAEAAKHNYTLVLAEFKESAETEMLTAQRLQASADGVILATSRLSDEAIRELYRDKPVAIINREVDDVPSIVADVDTGIGAAIRHLGQLGHTRLAYVAGPERSWMSHRRWESVKERCEWGHLTAVRIPGEAPTIEGGRRAAAAVRASGATAVMAYNDLVAIGLLQELISGGVRVPEDISIVGYDNIFGADFTTPPLTTVSAPLAESAAAAVRSILAELDGDEPRDVIEPLPTELVIRGSTARARRAE